MSGDGKLSKTEITRVLKENDDAIAFVEAHSALAPLLEPRTLAQVFHDIDQDGDGRLEFEELVRIC